MSDELLFERGKEEFNNAQYFDAHESWEELWQIIRHDTAKELETKQLQALIQCSVALHLFFADRLAGAKKVIERARLNIQESKAVYQNIDLESLYQEIIRFFENNQPSDSLNVKI